MHLSHSIAEILNTRAKLVVVTHTAWAGALLGTMHVACYVFPGNHWAEHEFLGSGTACCCVLLRYRHTARIADCVLYVLHIAGVLIPVSCSACAARPCAVIYVRLLIHVRLPCKAAEMQAEGATWCYCCHLVYEMVLYDGKPEAPKAVSPVGFSTIHRLGRGYLFVYCAVL